MFWLVCLGFASIYINECVKKDLYRKLICVQYSLYSCYKIPWHTGVSQDSALDYKSCLPRKHSSSEIYKTSHICLTAWETDVFDWLLVVQTEVGSFLNSVWEAKCQALISECDAAFDNEPSGVLKPRWRVCLCTMYLQCPRLWTTAEFSSVCYRTLFFNSD